MPKPSPFVWYELTTTDATEAGAFYRDLLGWTGQPWGPAGEYTIMHAGARPVAGVMALKDCPPCWLGYVAVDSVDAAAAAAVAAGARVVREPSDIPEVGRFAVMGDPQGAGFVLFTPKGEGGETAAPGTPGHVGWHELHAGDGKAAFAFYSAQFGWTQDQAMDMGPMGTYQTFAAGGPAIGGMMTKHPAMPMPTWLFYFNVPSIDAAVARIGALGGTVILGATDVPGGGVIAQALDPQGAMFAVLAPKR